VAKLFKYIPIFQKKYIYQNIRALPWRSGAAKDWRHPNKTNPIATNFILSETFLSLFCFLGTETVLDLI
jgi:hypothetical protein